MALTWQMAALLFAAGFWAGAQNALAGGGSFVTLPVLMLTGLDARIANLTSTVALFPGQVVSGLRGRGLIVDRLPLPLGWLIAINAAGGATGAGLLLATPSTVFAGLVPWLILFATVLFIASSSPRRDPSRAPVLGPAAFGGVQFAIAIYGGYFGGGGGFMVIAALALAGIASRSAMAFKNIVIALINAAAVVVFVFAGRAALVEAIVLGSGALIGGVAGVSVLRRIDERLLRGVVVVIGLALTAWLFAAAP